MKIYTIGFTKKSAEEFFSLLQNSGVKTLVDVRLNNSSQLAGFTKGNDLKYFLKTIAGIDYAHRDDLAPTKEILNAYKNKAIDWNQYEFMFKDLLQTRKPIIEDIVFNNACLLCSEERPDQCHRRLVGDYIRENLLPTNIEIIHL
ncbi:DUF488 domain-containing protein [Desulfitobacterium sp. THU1]|uniref:DUF488 domain-containing protein n=1 Tax=Desulfitobacterium sp. THU1 TaxID=3138072 RepID=UPI00311FDD80